MNDKLTLNEQFVLWIIKSSLKNLHSKRVTDANFKYMPIRNTVLYSDIIRYMEKNNYPVYSKKKGKDNLYRNLLYILKLLANGGYLRLKKRRMEDGIYIIYYSLKGWNWVKPYGNKYIPVFDDLDLSIRPLIHSGRRSQFTGHRIYRLITNNPRRLHTKGHRSWEAITHNGMIYEYFIRNGGIDKELIHEVEKKRAKVLLSHEVLDER